MALPHRNVPGQVYRCPVCGAEISVIYRGAGPLTPRCCNVPMQPLAIGHTIYVCPVCGSQLMVIRDGAGPLTPRCCNTPMRRIQRAA